MTTRDDGYTPQSGAPFGDDSVPTFGELLKQAAGTLGRDDEQANRMEPHIGPQVLGATIAGTADQGVGQQPLNYQPEAFPGQGYAEPGPVGGYAGPTDMPPPGNLPPSGDSWINRRFDAKTVVVAMAIVGVAGSGFATWLAYRAGANSGTNGAVPYVQADYDATKRLPDDPGGLDVPDRDKLVFENLSGAPAGDGVEHLLPPPEQPVARQAADRTSPLLPDRMPAAVENEDGPAIAAAPPAAAPVATSLNVPTASETGPTAQSRPQAVAPSFLPPTRPPAQSETVASRPAPRQSVPVETLLSAADQAAPQAGQSSGWRIQLASLRQAGDADSAWAQLSQRHGGVLSLLTLHVQEARLDAGTFYRIQAGPLAGRAEAGAACEALKANGQPCIVVAP